LPVEPKFGSALYVYLEPFTAPATSQPHTPRYAARDEGRMSKARATAAARAGFDESQVVAPTMH